MPARVKKIRHDDETRAKIQAAQIINRLQDAFNGKVVLDRTQVSIANILLAKVLPDLSSTTIAGDADNPLNVAHHGEIAVSDTSAFIAAAFRAKPESPPPKSRQN